MSKKPSYLPMPLFLLKRLLILSSLIFIIFEIGLSQSQSLRTVNIKVAVDEEYRSRKMWRFEIKRLITDSSKDFEKYFGIRFRIKKFDNWFSDNSKESTLELLNDLRKKVFKGDCDIVLGFTSQPSLKYDFSGAATYLHDYIVLRKLRSEVAMKSMLSHEFSHLFGAADLNEKGSIMHGKNLGQEFDEFTTRIILLNKNRNFNPYIFPLPKNKLDEAISIYNQRKKLNQREVGINILLAIFYLEKKDYESTLKECHQAIQIQPDLSEAYNLSGIAYRRKGEIDQAIRQYHKVLRLQPWLSDVHYNLGIAYMKKGMIDEAIKKYLTAIELNPDYAKAYLNLGHVYLEKEMADQAIEECQKALEIYPQLAKALSTLGGAYLLKNNFKEAEAFSLKALEINNELAGAHNNLGSIYMNKKMIDQAIEEYLKALEIDPEYTKGHYNLGRAYLIKGLTDKAIEKFKNAIQLKPDYHKAYSNLGSAYLEREMVEEAIKECKKAIEIKPDHAIAYSNLSHAYLKKGMIKEAEAACHQAIALNQSLAEPHNLLGILLEKEGKNEEAQVEYLKAIELKPDYHEAHLNLANVYFKRNLLPESAFHYKKVIEINPDFARAYNNLAVIFFYQKKYTLAWEYLKKAEDLGIKVHPEFKKELYKKLEKRIKENKNNLFHYFFLQSLTFVKTDANKASVRNRTAKISTSFSFTSIPVRESMRNFV